MVEGLFQFALILSMIRSLITSRSSTGLPIITVETPVVLTEKSMVTELLASSIYSSVDNRDAEDNNSNSKV